MANVFIKLRNTCVHYHRQFLDKSTPHVTARWCLFAFLFIAFSLRVVVGQGWYIEAYGFAIYCLNLFLAFLTPKISPALRQFADEDEADGPTLPTNNQQEFKPFIRRLPEFKFWYSATKAISIALLLTCSRAFDVPVFWPILLFYFLFLFAFTMKRQIQHMIRYKYVPVDIGKPKFAGRTPPPPTQSPLPPPIPANPLTMNK